MSGETRTAATEPASEPPIAPPAAGGAVVEDKIPMPGDTALAAAAGPAAAPAAGKDPSYDLALQVPSEGRTGQPVVANVRVTPGKGYKVNEEYPTKLTLEATDGVTAAKQVLAKADAATFDKHQLVFDVKLTPTRSGDFVVRGKLSFAVCTDATCDPKTEQIAINLRAK